MMRSSGSARRSIGQFAPVMATVMALVVATVSVLASQPVRAADGARVGDVSTTFRLLGRNDKIAVDRYDDPKLPGVSCYLSHAETGGVKGTLGVAVDPSRFSLSCLATSKITLPTDLPDNEVIFGQRTSLFWKELRVSRILDRQRQVLVYLAWSTRSLSTEGSPFNAVATVPVTLP